jgi:WD40 repeat protein
MPAPSAPTAPGCSPPVATSTLRLWDADSGAERLRCEGHADGDWHLLLACAFSPDGTRLLSAGSDGTLRLWDAASGAERLRCEGHRGWVNACAFSPDGTRLLSAGNDGTLRLWDAASGAERLRCEGHRGGVHACAFSPDGTRLLSAGATARCGSGMPTSGAERLRCEGHRGEVNACAFSPDGTRLLSAGDDGTLRLWDAASGELLRIHATVSGRWPGHAVWEPPTNRVNAWSGAAWRWLRWLATDANGQPDPLPLEAFADIPAADDA